MPELGRDRALLVAGSIATRRTDAERGPQVRMNPADCTARLLVEGELAWVHGPRRQELATVLPDERIKRGEVVVRDMTAASPSDTVRVVKPDLDSHTRRGFFA